MLLEEPNPERNENYDRLLYSVTIDGAKNVDLFHPTEETSADYPSGDYYDLEKGACKSDKRVFIRV